MKIENYPFTPHNAADDHIDGQGIITDELIDETIDNLWNGRGSPAYLYGRTISRIIPTDMIIDENENDYDR